MTELLIDKLADAVAKYIADFPEGDEWDELCTETLLEDGLLDFDLTAADEKLVYMALYCFTSDADPRFSNWRHEFRNEFH